MSVWIMAAALALPMVTAETVSARVAFADDGDDKVNHAEEDTAKAHAYRVRLKLPGGDEAVDAPTIAKAGTAEEWDIEVDGQHHVVRLQLNALDEPGRVQAELRYRRGETPIIDTTAELSVASWVPLETSDGATLQLWVDPKKHKRIKLPDSDDPLGGL